MTAEVSANHQQSTELSKEPETLELPKINRDNSNSNENENSNEKQNTDLTSNSNNTNSTPNQKEPAQPRPAARKAPPPRKGPVGKVEKLPEIKVDVNQLKTRIQEVTN
jgi:hypothetical protein